jgi:hypothetical protein
MLSGADANQDELLQVKYAVGSVQPPYLTNFRNSIALLLLVIILGGTQGIYVQWNSPTLNTTPVLTAFRELEEHA